MHINTIADFWRQVDKTDTCWNWIGAVTGNYGRFGYQKKKHGAHRFSWELAHGTTVPDGLDVLHSCDNPVCVRPEHLFAGTHTDNMRDMFAKGRRRIARGSRTARAKVNEADVAIIRRRCKNGETQKALATEYDLYPTAISQIVLRKTWKHVP